MLADKTYLKHLLSLQYSFFFLVCGFPFSQFSSGRSLFNIVYKNGSPPNQKVLEPLAQKILKPKCFHFQPVPSDNDSGNTEDHLIQTKGTLLFPIHVPTPSEAGSLFYYQIISVCVWVGEGGECGASTERGIICTTPGSRPQPSFYC